MQVRPLIIPSSKPEVFIKSYLRNKINKNTLRNKKIKIPKTNKIKNIIKKWMINKQRMINKLSIMNKKLFKI